MWKSRCLSFGFALLLSGCGSDNTYTLYRSGAGGSSVADEMRIHVATFDADEKAAYNRENCDVAKDLFQNQPGVTVRYWCEKGRFRK